MTLLQLLPGLVLGLVALFALALRDGGSLLLFFAAAGLDKALAVNIVPNVGDSSKKITGTLTFIDNTVDRATGTVLLKARVPNADLPTEIGLRASPANAPVRAPDDAERFRYKATSAPGAGPSAPIPCGRLGKSCRRPSSPTMCHKGAPRRAGH